MKKERYMFPSFDIVGYPVNYYWLFQFLAIWVAIFSGYYLLTKKLPEKLRWYQVLLPLICLIPIAYIGSKAIAILEWELTEGILNLSVMLVLDLLSDWGGGRVYGAYLAFFLFVPILVRILFSQQDYPIVLDIILFLTPLIVAVGKLGCFFSGHGCYGQATSLPWGMYFIYGSKPSLVPVHPTPLYDSLLHVSIFIFALYYPKNIATYLPRRSAIILLIALTCIFTEGFRTNAVILGNMSLAQVVYGIMVVVVGLKQWLHFKSKSIFVRITRARDSSGSLVK